MKKIILIHGYTSSPARRKYRIIARELDKLGVDCAIPEMPGGEHPRADEWLKVIDREVRGAGKPVVLVGHSLGTRAIILYLDRAGLEVDTVIMIAAFDNDIEANRRRKDTRLADFFSYAPDIGRIRKLAGRFVVAHARDDGVIDYRQGEAISGQLGAELVAGDGLGHFCGEERAAENAEFFLDLIKTALPENASFRPGSSPARPAAGPAGRPAT